VERTNAEATRLTFCALITAFAKLFSLLVDVARRNVGEGVAMVTKEEDKHGAACGACRAAAQPADIDVIGVIGESGAGAGAGADPSSSSCSRAGAVITG